MEFIINRSFFKEHASIACISRRRKMILEEYLRYKKKMVRENIGKYVYNYTHMPIGQFGGS